MSSHHLRKLLLTFVATISPLFIFRVLFHHCLLQKCAKLHCSLNRSNRLLSILYFRDTKKIWLYQNVIQTHVVSLVSTILQTLLEQILSFNVIMFDYVLSYIGYMCWIRLVQLSLSSIKDIPILRMHLITRLKYKFIELKCHPYLLIVIVVN